MRFDMLQKVLTASILAMAASCVSLPPTLAQDAPDPANALRLCADPANLPFSSDDPATPGLYLEIGEAIGKAIGRPVSHVWYRTYFGKRAVRVTMLAKQCDATIGLPGSGDFMGPKVIFSRPLFNVGYAIVAPKGANLTGVEDLRGKRVAVQFETEPQNIVAPRGDMEAVTVLSPEEGMRVLADGRADAAFLWAPSAGYLNKTAYDARFVILPVDGPRLSVPVAIGYAKTSAPLRDSIDAVLPEVLRQFPELLAKYGIRQDAQAATVSADKPAVIEKAALVSQASAPPPAAKPVQTADESAKPASDAAGDAAESFDVAPPMPPSTPELIAAGKEVFNGTCAHCHGPDAVQGVKKIDLRRLTLRYGDDATNTYWKTVHEGRPDKGMPTWKGVFTDEQFTQIYVFLSSVQSQE
jgi:mono/diheme cytochrome c family protein